MLLIQILRPLKKFFFFLNLRNFSNPGYGAHKATTIARDPRDQNLSPREENLPLPKLRIPEILLEMPYFKRTQFDIDSFPCYLGKIIRKFCPTFMSDSDPCKIQRFLENRDIFHKGTHHCLFWPCWLFLKCPYSNTTPEQLHVNSHWHCVYTDCPIFFGFISSPPYLANGAKMVYNQ